MKTISLWQPWASLVAAGAKRIETRHWRAPASIVGQRIAIHAAKYPSHLHLAAHAPYRDHLPQGDLPTGAIICTATLIASEPITETLIADLCRHDPDEYAFGFYLRGRWAWHLADATPLPEPITFRGFQGFFDVPDDLVGHTPAQERLL